ncbi:MAG: TetR/AcrR family transcriptional regulator [Planctomycetota bacterium]|nr:TetR/AcrR family transcriptional regulator [Planctomycetota bacterium]MEC8496234.1 TetR/AcrR family transcriptional regulator [Planctomycetota bacterium]MEC8513064.1 TetR/AcrR family transcriptional regulator [Planctomycetota bacterium]
MTDTSQQRGTGADLKRAILDEARKTLVEQGYPALSTRKIASAVGCTATSIYLYFKSKDALVHALIDEGFEELNGRLEEAVAVEGTGLERLQRGARAFVDFGLERPAYYEIMFLLRPERMERYPAEAYRRARRSLEAFAELASVPAAEGLRRATIVMTSLHGLVALLIAQRIDASLDRKTLIEEAIHFACAATLAPRSGDGAS